MNLGSGLLCGTCAETAARETAPAVPGVTRNQLREMVSAAIDAALWDAESPPASEAVLEVVWPLLKRAQAAEAKLAEVRAVLLEGGQDHGTTRRRALAIVGSDEETPDMLGGLEAELGEARSEGEMIRDHANRFLRAVYGPDVVYRAPETFGNLLERWLWAIGAGVPEIAHACIADIERHCAFRDARTGSSEEGDHA